jgi:5,10-methylenetetrahydrofolate reductase
MRLSSIGMSKIIKDRGFEPIVQFTCRDRNRLALQSDALTCASLGMHNILCLGGDPPTIGDHPDTKPVFDLDVVNLIKALKGLTEGKDLSGNTLDGAPELFIGAAATPDAKNIEVELQKFEAKVRAGAGFFQTQAVFNPNVFENFMRKVEGFKVPILAGIIILKSVKMAKYMNENIPGINVPENMIKELESAKKQSPPKGVDIAKRLIKEIRPLCQGIHIMALGWDKYIPLLVESE